MGQRWAVVAVVAVIAVIALALVGCGAASAGRVTLHDIPTATFMRCEIPSGQPTWAHVTLTGGEPPFRGVWSIDGTLDSTSPQRAVPVPRGTRLEILVSLKGTGQTFRVQGFNRHGLVETVSWTNNMNGETCDPDGEPKPRS